MIEELLLIPAFMIFTSAYGLLRFPEMNNIVYARIHITGVLDIACILALIILGYPFIGLTYLVLVPLAGHAIANAHHIRGVRK